MLASLSALVSAYPRMLLPAGTAVMRRSEPVASAIFVESGRVLLGIAAHHDGSDCADVAMEHQLGVVEGPAWLEANTVVLGLPAAVDAQAETGVVLRHMPVRDFCAVLAQGPLVLQAVLHDVARAQRQQIELAVSRLAMDAEARCAEWLLRHARASERGEAQVELQQRKRSIAAQLGIAPETLSRVLRQLRERSLISGSGRILNLVDPGALRLLAGLEGHLQ